MAKIKVPSDCGNSPKKLFLKELYTALANGDDGFLIAHLADNAYWKYIGKWEKKSKSNIEQQLTQLLTWKASSIELTTIVTHGTTANVNGKVVAADKRKYEFSENFQFTSAASKRIQGVTSFFI